MGKALSISAGAFRDAEAFMATLVSGVGRTVVEVDVTSGAWEEVKEEIGRSPKSFRERGRVGNGGREAFSRAAAVAGGCQLLGGLAGPQSPVAAGSWTGGGRIFAGA